jgi:hypothetical protein
LVAGGDGALSSARALPLLVATEANSSLTGCNAHKGSLDLFVCAVAPLVHSASTACPGRPDAVGVLGGALPSLIKVSTSAEGILIFNVNIEARACDIKVYVFFFITPFNGGFHGLSRYFFYCLFKRRHKVIKGNQFPFFFYFDVFHVFYFFIAEIEYFVFVFKSEFAKFLSSLFI